MTEANVAVEDPNPENAPSGLVALLERKAAQQDATKADAASAGTKERDQAAEAKASETPSNEAPPTEAEKPVEQAPDMSGLPDRLRSRLNVLIEIAKDPALPQELREKARVTVDDLKQTKDEYLANLAFQKKAKELSEEKARLREWEKAVKEKIEAYDLLRSDPRKKDAFLKALASADGDDEGDFDFDVADPKAKKDYIRREAQRVVDRQRQEEEAQAAKSAGKAKLLLDTAEEHLKTLGEQVTAEQYRAAADAYGTELTEMGLVPVEHLTPARLVAGVNRHLKRMSEETSIKAEIESLKKRLEQFEGSKREAARAAKASSQPGIRTTETDKADLSTRKGRLQKTLADIGLAENPAAWNEVVG